MSTTRVKNAEVVIAYDADQDTHVYRRDCDVVFDEDRILHIGAGYQGMPDLTVDGRGLMAMPGLVNVHSHPGSEPGNKGLTDEVGSPRLYNTSLYEYLWLFRADAEGIPHTSRMAWCELLMSGVTTLVDLSFPSEGWVDRAAESGLRLVLAPMYRNGRWFTRNGYSVEYELDAAEGRKAMDWALAVIDAAVGHPCGRLSGLICPAQIDTCTEALIRDSLAAARERKMPIQIHAAQSISEFQEIVRRTGLTAVQWLDQLGYLGPRASIGHGIFLDHHPWVRWGTRTDLGRLAETGTSVAHCPTVFARRGVTLRDLGSYLKAGVNVGIGTDTYPHNMLEELRHAGVYARITAQTPFNVTSGDVFRCATLGGARLLGRDDIGRIALGAKPDLVLVDLRHPMMQPAREPLRSLIYAAAERAVRHVFVAGRQVVRDGKVLTMDYAAAADGVNDSQKRALAKVPELDWAGRSIDELAPPSFRYQGSNVR
jgi:cytosine/adenosine deaminase-related metal-dependent hydrolase